METLTINKTGHVLEECIKDHVSDVNSAIKQHHMNTGHPLPNPQDKDIKVGDNS